MSTLLSPASAICSSCPPIRTDNFLLSNMKTLRLVSSLVAALVASFILPLSAAETTARWSPEEASAWYARQPWMVGCNFTPSTAINQLEMWQADTFDPATIDRELGWAEQVGYNSVRVFLHHLAWEQDPRGFLKRMDQFLSLTRPTQGNLKPPAAFYLQKPTPSFQGDDRNIAVLARTYLGLPQDYVQPAMKMKPASTDQENQP